MICAQDCDYIEEDGNRFHSMACLAMQTAWRDRTVVTLCGSTRFWRTFQQASLHETMAGKIVLSIGAASGTDDEHFGNLPAEQYFAVKEDLDRLHLDKIALGNEVIILNVDDYVGQSTRRELEWARRLGKPIRWWVWPSAHALPSETAGQNVPCETTEPTP